MGADADRSVRTNPSEPPARTRAARPLVVRLTHWVGAFALGCMILSGWQIYNASPLLPFVFPARVTLGGWLAAGIAWHLAAKMAPTQHGAIPTRSGGAQISE